MGSVNQSLKKDWIFSYKLRNLEFIAGTEWGSSSEGILKIHHLEAWVCLDSWLASPRRFIGWSTLWLRSTEDFGLFYDIHGCSDSAFGFGRKKEDGVRLPQLPVSADHDLAALGMLKYHPGLGSWQLEKCGGCWDSLGHCPTSWDCKGHLGLSPSASCMVQPVSHSLILMQGHLHSTSAAASLQLSFNWPIF